MRVLYVEDDSRDADLVRRVLARAAPHVRLDVVGTKREAMEWLDGDGPSTHSVLLTDLRLPDGDGREILADVRRRGLPLPVVVITGCGDEETVVALMKAGADDYVVKRHDYLERLPATLEHARRRLNEEVERRGRTLRVLYAEHAEADIDLTRRHLLRHAPHVDIEIVHTIDQVIRRLTQDDRSVR